MHCDNCGTELLAGQRFCRSCGRATDDFSEESTPTQRMPPEQQVRGMRDTATTAPSRADTSPVYTPPDQNYYQPYAPIQPGYPMQSYAPPPRSRSPWGWIIALIAVFLIGAVGLGAFIINRASRTPPGRGMKAPPPPPPPPGVGKGLTRTYPLSSGARVDLSTIQGNVKIVGWDQQQAEVTTSGGNADIRANNSDSLSLTTNPRFGDISVDYEIKLPRNVGRVQIKAAMADIDLSGINGEVVIETGTGSVTLSGINGRVDVKAGTGDVTVSDSGGEVSIKCGTGDVTASFSDGIRGPVSIEAPQGDVAMRFGPGVNANFEASTNNGEFDFDESLGFDVRESRGGKEAKGRIGSGGSKISVTSQSGDITATRE